MISLRAVMLLLFSILFAVSSALVIPPKAQLTGKALTDYVNSAQSLWTAGEPVFPKEKLMRSLMRPRLSEGLEMPIKTDIAAVIPTMFDARVQWSNCMSISYIRDESECGSSWALSAVEAISDRTCIASNGTVNTLISAEDLLTCCKNCDFGNGCDGGIPFKAWMYWLSDGLVTGGAYGSGFGCKPYSIPPNQEGSELQSNCVAQCTGNNSYPIPYANDKHFGSRAYKVGAQAAQIQTEIMTNGPVEANFIVYEDFYQYTGGIYVHTGGQELGEECVRILGWGVENGTPYWMVANVWGKAWGEQGYFKILRGVDECGIESSVIAGLPDLARTK